MASPQVVLCTLERDRVLAESVDQALALEFDVYRMRTPDATRRHPLIAWCTVVVDALTDAGTAPGLSFIRRTWPSMPAILVTPRRHQSLRPHDGLAEALVWADEVSLHLCPSVRRVRIGSVKAAARLAIAAMPDLTPLSRGAALAALRLPRPARSVTELAQTLRCSRVSLSRGWKPRGAGQWGQLQYLLDWVLLVEALGMRRPGLTWSDVAARLHIHERTLARSARRFFGMATRVHGKTFV